MAVTRESSRQGKATEPAVQDLRPKPVFPSLAEAGHRTLDMSVPSGVKPWQPWLKRDPWFPDGPGASWSDVYRTWFGDVDRPVVSYHLMGGCPPSWDERIRAAYEHLWREAMAGTPPGWPGGV